MQAGRRVNMHEDILGSKLTGVQASRSCGWTWSVLCLFAHDFLEATQKPGSISDLDRQASGLNKMISHGCIALDSGDLHRVFAACIRVALPSPELTNYATLDLNDKVHQLDSVKPYCINTPV